MRDDAWMYIGTGLLFAVVGLAWITFMVLLATGNFDAC